jgi:regulator of chromosome condensation
MAPRKASVKAAEAISTSKKTAAGKQSDGAKSTAKSTTKKTSTEKATVTKTTTTKSKAATKKEPIAKKETATKTKAAKPASTEKKVTTSKKRKADEVDDEQPKANISKRRKSHDEEEESPAPPAKRVTAAAKKPKVVKPKVVINHAPTQRLDIYVSGEGSQGELGLGAGKGSMNALKPRLNPHLSAADVGVVQLATGGMHCAALTYDNKILTWGVNDDGALGRDTQWDGGMRDVDDNKSDDSSEDAELNPREATPTVVEFEDLPENTIFTQVAAGDSSTFVLTDEGQVYGWGTFRVSSCLPTAVTVH